MKRLIRFLLGGKSKPAPVVQKRAVPAHEAALKQAVARRRDANAKDGEQGAVKSEASAVAVPAFAQPVVAEPVPAKSDAASQSTLVDGAIQQGTPLTPQVAGRQRRKQLKATRRLKVPADGGEEQGKRAAKDQLAEIAAPSGPNRGKRKKERAAAGADARPKQVEVAATHQLVDIVSVVGVRPAKRKPGHQLADVAGSVGVDGVKSEPGNRPVVAGAEARLERKKLHRKQPDRSASAHELSLTNIHKGL